MLGEAYVLQESDTGWWWWCVCTVRKTGHVCIMSSCRIIKSYLYTSSLCLLKVINTELCIQQLVNKTMKSWEKRKNRSKRLHKAIKNLARTQQLDDWFLHTSSFFLAVAMVSVERTVSLVSTLVVERRTRSTSASPSMLPSAGEGMFKLMDELLFQANNRVGWH